MRRRMAGVSFLLSHRCSTVVIEMTCTDFFYFVVSMGTVQLRSPVARETGEWRKGAMIQKEEGQTDIGSGRLLCTAHSFNTKMNKVSPWSELTKAI